MAPTRALVGNLLQIAGCIPAFSTRGKGVLGTLLSALAGASKRETPTSNLTESNDYPCIFSPQMEAIVFTGTFLQIFFAMHIVVKSGKYSWIFLSFSWGIFGHWINCA